MKGHVSLPTLRVPLALPSVANLREHWAARAKRSKEQRGITTLALRAAFRPPAPPLEVELVRVAPRKLDDDNLASAFKAVRDGVQDWLGLDDGSELLRFRYAQQPSKNHNGFKGIHITIWRRETMTEQRDEKRIIPTPELPPPTTQLRELPVKLSTKELADRADELTRMLAQHDELEDQAKNAAAEQRAELKKIRARCVELRRIYMSGEEPRLVEVEERRDYSASEVITVRLDTGAAVECRAMTEAERQSELPLEGATVHALKRSRKGGKGAQA